MKYLKNENIYFCGMYTSEILIFTILLITEAFPAVIEREKQLPVEIFKTDEEATERVMNLAAIEKYQLEKEEAKDKDKLLESSTESNNSHTQEIVKQDPFSEKKDFIITEAIVDENLKEKHLNNNYITGLNQDIVEKMSIDNNNSNQVNKINVLDNITALNPDNTGEIYNLLSQGSEDNNNQKNIIETSAMATDDLVHLMKANNQMKMENSNGQILDIVLMPTIKHNQNMYKSEIPSMILQKKNKKMPSENKEPTIIDLGGDSILVNLKNNVIDNSQVTQKDLNLDDILIGKQNTIQILHEISKDDHENINNKLPQKLLNDELSTENENKKKLFINNDMKKITVENVLKSNDNLQQSPLLDQNEIIKSMQQPVVIFQNQVPSDSKGNELTLGHDVLNNNIIIKPIEASIKKGDENVDLNISYNEIKKKIDNKSDSEPVVLVSNDIKQQEDLIQINPVENNLIQPINSKLENNLLQQVNLTPLDLKNNFEETKLMNNVDTFEIKPLSEILPNNEQLRQTREISEKCFTDNISGIKNDALSQMLSTITNGINKQKQLYSVEPLNCLLREARNIKENDELYEMAKENEIQTPKEVNNLNNNLVDVSDSDLLKKQTNDGEEPELTFKENISEESLPPNLTKEMKDNNQQPIPKEMQQKLLEMVDAIMKMIESQKVNDKKIKQEAYANDNAYFKYYLPQATENEIIELQPITNYLTNKDQRKFLEDIVLDRIGKDPGNEQKLSELMSIISNIIKNVNVPSYDEIQPQNIDLTNENEINVNEVDYEPYSYLRKREISEEDKANKKK